MQKNLSFAATKMSAAQKDALMIEAFLDENYRFRRNVISGKPEFVNLSGLDNETEKSSNQDYRVLDNIALNSIVRRARIEGVAKNPRQHIEEYIFSNMVEAYDPIADYLNKLPEWNGEDIVASVLNRLPGLTDELRNYLRVWLRSMVAHWLQMDTLHGNECVPTLIGAQGCGKSTFVQRLLPQELRSYFLDHLNLSNKFDKEMALTNNLLVNLDELDAIRPSQHAALKQTLSKSKVNGRTIFGSTQQDRPRYASFVATTNNLRPLNDATGSRRYLCIQIPKGHYIDNAGAIDYVQFFAQILHEIQAEAQPYWFNNAEVQRIQDLNMRYMSKMELPDMLSYCFRKPEQDEQTMPISSEAILEILGNKFPTMQLSSATKISLGFALSELGYERMRNRNGNLYYAVPLNAA